MNPFDREGGTIMRSGRRTRSLALVAAGLAIGLTIGAALALGVWLGQRGPVAAALPGLEELKLKAMASHGTDTFAIATGPIDDDVEGLFTLDFLTGDLTCFVINPRNGLFGGMFKANVSNVLKVEKGKKPNYLMVTGTIQTSGTAGGQRPAGSLCYVVDANTGDVAAFTFPWVKAATTVGVAQATEMRVVGSWKTRAIDLRQ
jgi:hypothetical protein